MLLLFAIWGCAPLSTIGTYNRDPYICSKPNYFGMRVDVVLQDNERHQQWIGWANPGTAVCGYWSLSGDRGRWGYVRLNGRGGADTTWTMWFQATQLR